MSPDDRSPEEDASYFASIWGLSEARRQQLEQAFRVSRENAIKALASPPLSQPRAEVIAGLEKAKAVLADYGFFGRSVEGRGDPEVNSIDAAIAALSSTSGEAQEALARAAQTAIDRLDLLIRSATAPETDHPTATRYVRDQLAEAVARANGGTQ